MRIFLVRHGESVAQLEQNAYAEYGDPNVPLTQWGYKQAVAAGRALGNYLRDSPNPNGKKPVIVHSPFVRTQQTKDGLIKGMGGDNTVNQILSDDNLTERSHGLAYFIRAEQALKRIFPEEYAEYEAMAAKNDLYNMRPPTGESMADVQSRLHQFKEKPVKQLIAEGCEDLVVVGHTNTNRAFAMEFLGLGPDWFQESVGQGNADIMMFEGDLENGFTITPIHTSKPRPPSLKNEAKPYRPEQAQGIYL